MYLTINWTDSSDCSLFDTREDTLSEVVDFIDMTLRCELFAVHLNELI